MIPTQSNAARAVKGNESGAVLRAVPDTRDRHRVGGRDPVDDEVCRYDHQLPRAGLVARPTAAGKHHQAVAGTQELAADRFGCDQIVGSDIAHDAADIS